MTMVSASKPRLDGRMVDAPVVRRAREIAERGDGP